MSPDLLSELGVQLITRLAMTWPAAWRLFWCLNVVRFVELRPPQVFSSTCWKNPDHASIRNIARAPGLWSSTRPYLPRAVNLTIATLYLADRTNEQSRLVMSRYLTRSHLKRVSVTHSQIHPSTPMYYIAAWSKQTQELVQKQVKGAMLVSLLVWGLMLW